MLKVKGKREFSDSQAAGDKGMEIYLCSLNGIQENASGLGKLYSCRS